MYLGCMWLMYVEYQAWLNSSRLDGIVPNTPVPQRSVNGSTKRKSAFDTPAVPKFNKANGMSSPSDARANGRTNGVQYVDALPNILYYQLIIAEECRLFRAPECRAGR